MISPLYCLILVSSVRIDNTTQLWETHKIETPSLMMQMQQIFTRVCQRFQFCLKSVYKMRHGSPHCLHAQVRVNPDVRPVLGA